jgi:hypothetical protein
MTRAEADRAVRTMEYTFARSAVAAIVAAAFAVGAGLLSVPVAVLVVAGYVAISLAIWMVLRRRAYAQVAR